MRPRLFLSAAAAITVAAGLVACTSPEPDSTEASGICATPSGSASDSIEAEGAFDEAPTVTVPEGLEVEQTQRTVLIEGDGPELQEGWTADVAITFANGATGEQIEQYGYAEGQPPANFVLDTSQFPGIARALGCVTEGSRIAAVIPAAEAFGEQGNEQAGLGAGEPLAVVIDVLGSSEPLPDVSEVPQAADGEPQPAPEGFPAVTLGENGEPSIDVAGVEPPSELEVAVLKEGDGEVVPEGANVIVQYKGVLLSDGTEFDSSWSRGEPATFSLTGVVPGFSQAIAGQTVGSQVIAVIPPELAYGDQENGSIPANSTLVFVIDILAAA